MVGAVQQEVVLGDDCLCILWGEMFGVCFVVEIWVQSSKSLVDGNGGGWERKGTEKYDFKY